MVLRLTANASGSTITGIDDGVEQRHLRVISLSANVLTIGHQDTASATANRIISPTGSDVTMGIDDVVDLEYDATTARWRVTNIQL